MYELDEDLKKVGYVLQYKKRKAKIYIFLPVLLFIMYMFFPMFGMLFGGLIFHKLIFNMFGLYFVLLFSIIGIFAIGRDVLSYFGNKIIISDSFVTIRRVVLGKTYIISKDCIVGKRGFEGRNEKWIYLYLKNGKKVSTGCLHCSHKVFEKIYNEFDFDEIRNKKGLPDFYNDVEITKDKFIVKTNYIFPVLNYLMLIVFIVGCIFLSSRFNYNYGPQDKFQINGTVVSKEISNGKANQYKMIVIEDNGPQEYNVEVSSKIYEKFDLKDKISITGKRGSLGILYDINYTNVGNV